MTTQKLIDNMQLSVNCLALELPAVIHNDVSSRWNALKSHLADLTQPFACPDGLSCSGDGSDCVGQYRCVPAGDVYNDGFERTIFERDQYESVADNLSEAIAEYFNEEIGEHSSGNCPWDNALDIISNADKRALSQQITKPHENVSCADLTNDALEQAICDLEMHRDSNFHVMEQKNVVLLIDTLCSMSDAMKVSVPTPVANQKLVDAINSTIQYFEEEFPKTRYPDVWDKPHDMHAGGLTPNQLYKVRELLSTPAANQAALDDDFHKLCSQCWEALGITEYTGKHIVEHIRELRTLTAPQPVNAAEAQTVQADLIEQAHFYRSLTLLGCPETAEDSRKFWDVINRAKERRVK